MKSFVPSSKGQDSLGGKAKTVNQFRNTRTNHLQALVEPMTSSSKILNESSGSEHLQIFD